VKFIISHKGVKREIDGSFEICCGVDDFWHLAKFLYGEYLRQRDGSERGLDERFSYGWISVPSRCDSEMAANTPPIPWCER